MENLENVESEAVKVLKEAAEEGNPKGAVRGKKTLPDKENPENQAKDATEILRASREAGLSGWHGQSKDREISFDDEVGNRIKAAPFVAVLIALLAGLVIGKMGCALAVADTSGKATQQATQQTGQGRALSTVLRNRQCHSPAPNVL